MNQNCNCGGALAADLKTGHGIGHGFVGTEIIHGDLLHVLPTFPDKLFGGIICDPPYASGAAGQNARQKTTAQKYSSAKPENALPDFEGDSKDQRSWTHWIVNVKRKTSHTL